MNSMNAATAKTAPANAATTKAATLKVAKAANASTTNVAAGASPAVVRCIRPVNRKPKSPAQASTQSEPRAQASGLIQTAPPARLTLRPACASDLTPLCFFFDTILRRDYFIRRGQLEELVNGPHHQVLVAELDEVLVGVAVTTGSARLINVLVHPAYRGLGIGRVLIHDSGASEVRAKLDMSAGDPRAFYRRLGFVSTNKRNEKGNIEILRRPTDAAGNAAAGPRTDRSQRGRLSRTDNGRSEKRTCDR